MIKIFLQYTTIWLVFISFPSFGQQTKDISIKKERPTVALVLSGGGAKGFAHTAVLEVIDSLDIPIDYIVGTSMGGVVGGMYAMGFSGKYIINEIYKHNWESIFIEKAHGEYSPVHIRDETDRYAISLPLGGGVPLPKGAIEGQKIMNMLLKYSINFHNTKDFSKLPIPYSCVAVNLETGKYEVLDKGFLPKAIRASIGIPYIFKPVEIDGKLYVDGGFVNNFPVNVAKNRGFDYVIGVDVQAPLRKKEEIKTVIDVTKQLSAVAMKPMNDKNRKLCDIYINPKLKNYNITSFEKENIKSIIQRGREAVQKAIPELIKLKKKLGKNAHKKDITNHYSDSNIRFKHIVVNGINKKILLRVLNLKTDNIIKLSRLEKKMKHIPQILNLDMISYQLKGDTLIFRAKKNIATYLNIGIKYNKETHSSVLLNLTSHNKLIPNSRLSLDVILGRDLQLTGRYNINLKNAPSFNFIIDAKRYNQNIYYKNSKRHFGNITFVRADLNTNISLWNRYLFGFGIRKEYARINNELEKYINIKDRKYIQTGNYWSNQVYAFIQINTLDNINFPKKGTKFDAELKYIGVNGLQKIITSFYTELRKAYSIHKSFSIITKINGSASINNNYSIYTTAFGGDIKNKYISYHIPFLGTYEIQQTFDVIATARVDFRYKLFHKNYLILSGNYGRAHDTIEGFINKNANIFWGGGISYSYDSLIGPISSSLTYSNTILKPIVFINIGYNF